MTAGGGEPGACGPFACGVVGSPFGEAVGPFSDGNGTPGTTCLGRSFWPPGPGPAPFGASGDSALAAGGAPGSGGAVLFCPGDPGGCCPCTCGAAGSLFGKAVGPLSDGSGRPGKTCLGRSLLPSGAGLASFGVSGGSIFAAGGALGATGGLDDLFSGGGGSFAAGGAGAFSGGGEICLAGGCGGNVFAGGGNSSRSGGVGTALGVGGRSMTGGGGGAALGGGGACGSAGPFSWLFGRVRSRFCFSSSLGGGSPLGACASSTGCGPAAGCATAAATSGKKITLARAPNRPAIMFWFPIIDPHQ